jgi:hypothetical protein
MYQMVGFKGSTQEKRSGYFFLSAKEKAQMTKWYRTL